MQHWDVFHSDRLEAERSLTTEAVRDALARGELTEDDLVRPAGETRWTRMGDSVEFGAVGPSIDESLAVELEPPPAFEPPTIDDVTLDSETESDLTRFEIDPESLSLLARDALARAEREPSPEFDPPQNSDFEIVNEDEDEPDPEFPASPVLPDEEAEAPDLPELNLGKVAEFDVMVEDDYVDEQPELEYDPQEEDEAAAEFTLSRSSAGRVEELDLAAMVDVAFQLVLFFLVTAQVVLFKTLEIPRPNEDKPPEAAAQGRTKSVDELEKDYILVEVDAAGAIKVDRQPVPASRPALVERLRKSREDTARKAVLLSADFATRHENAVLVLDVANEIDLRIAIAQPSAKK
jgi:biopolymer transport protein ExbD